MLLNSLYKKVMSISSHSGIYLRYYLQNRKMIKFLALPVLLMAVSAQASKKAIF